MTINSNLSSLNGNEGLILDQDISLNGALLFPKGKELTEENLDKLKNFLLKNNIDLNTIKLSVSLQPGSKNYSELAYLNHNTMEETIDKNTQYSIESLLEEIENTEKAYLSRYLRKIDSTASVITEIVLRSDEFSYNLANYKEEKPYNDVINIIAFSAILARNYKPQLDRATMKNITTAALLCKYGEKYNNKNDEIQKLSFNDAFIRHTNEYDVKDNYKEEYQTSYAYSSFKGLLSNTTLMMLLDSNKAFNEIPNKSENASYIGSRIIHLATLYNDLLKEALTYNKIDLKDINNLLKMAVNSKAITNEERMLLINTIPLYSKNERIKLSDGNYGIIENTGKLNSNTNTEFCDKPVVRVLSSEQEYLVDLKNDYTVRISDIVSNNERLTENKERKNTDNIINFQNMENTSTIKTM